MVKTIPMHPRAAAAKQRKEDKKVVESIKKNQEQEKQYWQDDDKISGRKQARKHEKDVKRLETLMSKEKKKILLEEEVKQLTEKDSKIPRVTKKDITDHIEKERKNNLNSSIHKNSDKKLSKSTHSKQDSECVSDEEALLVDIPKNLNRMNDNVLHARGVEDALNLLQSINLEDDAQIMDRNPEKRQRAAYKAYCDREMVRLKMEQPSLSYSQRQQTIFKNWQKSPENPVYKRLTEKK